MTDLVFVVIFSLNFVLFSCKGKIFLPDHGDTFVVLPGENVTIAWKIDPNIPVSDFKIRSWRFVPTGKTFAEIIGNGTVKIKNNGSILMHSFKIIKPSTLVLKNVDKRFNGQYTFSVRVGDSFTLYESVVEVFVAVTSMVVINSSSPITLNQSNYFACECKGQGGNPPADVTWFKGNESVVTGKEEAILRLLNVGKNDSATYTCEAKSHEKAKNVTSIEVIVNYPPAETILEFIDNGNKSFTLTCKADAHPAATFEIYFHDQLIISNKTYIIPEVNSSYVGNYKCVATNILGNDSSNSKYLSTEGTVPATRTSTSPTRISGTATTHPPWQELMTTMKGNVAAPTTHPPWQDLTTTMKGNKAACSNDRNGGTEWYIIMVTLVSGIIVGILLSYIVSCSRRRWRRNKKPQPNPEAQTNEVDTTYQELDLSKMNTEDNYQSLRVNTASNNALSDDSSTYAELNKIRDAENHYQSLT